MTLTRRRALFAAALTLIAAAALTLIAVAALTVATPVLAGQTPAAVPAVDAKKPTCVPRPKCVTPTPTPTATPTASPTTSPTAEPTPTATPTTDPTTATPTPTPTATPTAPSAGCMPDPSACGYPDADNTGPTIPLRLAPVGDVHLTTPGEVYEGWLVQGGIYVRADNVTVRNVRIVTDHWFPIRQFYGPGCPDGPDCLKYGGTIITDVEIDGLGTTSNTGISGIGRGYTATRVHWHDIGDCAHLGYDVTITDSFCEPMLLPAGSTAHSDGFQSDGGARYRLIHNTIINPNDQTSAILMSTNSGPISDVVISRNLVTGGGYTIYCGTDQGGVASNLTLTDNRFARTYFPQSGYYAPTVWCGSVAVNSGNVWDESGLPL